MKKPTYTRGVFSLAVAAVISVIVLLGVFAWKISDSMKAEHAYQKTAVAPLRTGSFVATDSMQNSNTATPWFSSQASSSATGTPKTATDQLLQALISGYVGLKQGGQYSTAAGQSLVQTVAAGFTADVAYKKHNVSELKTTSDTSETRALSYRADMRVALAPLLQNTEPPFATLGRYTVGGDKNALDDLSKESARYRASEALLTKVVVPVDAAHIHVNIEDSLAYSAAVIDDMKAGADDPVAVAIVLKQYNDVETAVTDAFSNLAKYYVAKVTQK